MSLNQLRKATWNWVLILLSANQTLYTMFLPPSIRKKKGPKPTSANIAGNKENVARQDVTPDIAGGIDNGEPKKSAPREFNSNFG